MSNRTSLNRRSSSDQLNDGWKYQAPRTGNSIDLLMALELVKLQCFPNIDRFLEGFMDSLLVAIAELWNSLCFLIGAKSLMMIPTPAAGIAVVVFGALLLGWIVRLVQNSVSRDEESQD